MRNNMNDKIKTFDEYAENYDEWFDRYNYAYESELNSIREFIPKHGLGVEIGVGTGRFAKPFSISIGVEPAEGMAEIAESRGITVHNTTAEDLPFCKEYFDFVLMVTTFCFLDNPDLALQNIHKILKADGKLIIGIIDKNSELGKNYQELQQGDRFYKYANFYSVEEVIELLKNNDFEVTDINQTIFENPVNMKKTAQIKSGYGEGSFVAVKADRKNVNNKR